MEKLEEPIQKSPRRLILKKIFPIIVALGGYYFDYIKDWVVAIVSIVQDEGSNDQILDEGLRSRGIYGAWMIVFTFFPPLVNLLDSIINSLFNLVLSTPKASLVGSIAMAKKRFYFPKKFNSTR